jgi:flagellar assembly protein FliH
MIIKEKYAQQLTASSHPPVESAQRGLSSDRIEEPSWNPEEFETEAMNRRRSDRREGYRRTEDRELISRAHEEANAIREAAAQEGLKMGLEESQALIDQLHETIQDFLEAKEKALLSASDQLAEMAIEIAEQILKTEVTCDENLVLSLVRHTIAKVDRGHKSITIITNPVDMKLVRETMKTDSGLSSQVEILVREDQSVDQGSCMIETQAGLIDTRFSTQLELLSRLVLTGVKS